MIRRVRRAESGFTLIELLVAVSVGIIVVLAAMAVLDLGVKQTQKVVDREDSVSRARVAMYTISNQLRSQVCLNSTTPPIVAGSPYSVTFYTFMGSGAFAPELHQIYWDTNSQSIIEKDWTGTPPNQNNAPARTTTLLTNVVPPGPSGGNQPIFSFFGFNQAPSGSVTWDRALPATLGAADTGQVVHVQISFTVLATRGGSQTAPANAPSTSLTEDVLSRVASPNDPAGPTAAECA